MEAGTPDSGGMDAGAAEDAIARRLASLDGLEVIPGTAGDAARAVAALHDLAWIVRSRTFDAGAAPKLRRALERVAAAAAIVTARRSGTTAVASRIEHAVRMLADTVERDVASLTAVARSAADASPAAAPARSRDSGAQPGEDAAPSLDRAA